MLIIAYTAILLYLFGDQYSKLICVLCFLFSYGLIFMCMRETDDNIITNYAEVILNLEIIILVILLHRAKNIFIPPMKNYQNDQFS